MIRLVRSLALTSLLLSLPVSASALGISITNVSSSSGSGTLFAGDTVTVDLVVENNAGAEVNGLGLIANGYDEDRNGVADSGLAFQSGSVTGSLFNTTAVPGSPNLAFGGLSNVRAGTGPIEQFVFSNFNPQSLRTSFFAGADLGSVNGTGGDDVGVGGDFVSNGDIHFQLIFIAGAVSPGLTSQTFDLEFGTNAEFGEVAIGPGGATLDFTNANLSLTVIPEPGTALLMGLGLAGLATRRR